MHCSWKQKKKKKFYLSHRFKKSFLFLSHFVPLSLSQITQLSFTLLNHSQSVPLFLSQITHPLPKHPSSSSHPFDPVVLRPQITHRRSFLTIMLSRLVSHSSVDWVWLWDGIDEVWLFRGCAPVGFCGYASVSFVVVRSDLWAGGATMLWFVVGRRPLWICGGHSVGLWRWGCGVGIMEVWLWVWDCGGGQCCGFTSDKREEKSREKEKNK